MPTPSSITRTASAKINLYLHITGQREDGYHELDSLVAFVGVGDVITVTQGDDLKLTITGPFAQGLSPGEDNLVVRAARLLAKESNVAANAHITLEKNLPVASGIGGGSADAAATLKALIEFWNIELADEDIHHVAKSVSNDLDTQRTLCTLFKVWRDDLDLEMLARIGLQLGADVPVCLAGQPVFMRGIGENLELAPHLPKAWLVLVNPGAEVSTPTVFQTRTDMMGDTYSQPAPFFNHPRDAAHLAELLNARTNDLMAPAIRLESSIQDVLNALSALKGCLLARMSGSGATCFALFAQESEAKAAAQNLAKTQPNWWIEAAELLDMPLDF